MTTTSKTHYTKHEHPSMEGFTTGSVCHRPSNIHRCDVVLVNVQGKITPCMCTLVCNTATPPYTVHILPKDFNQGARNENGNHLRASQLQTCKTSAEPLQLTTPGPLEDQEAPHSASIPTFSTSLPEVHVLAQPRPDSAAIDAWHHHLFRPSVHCPSKQRTCSPPSQAPFPPGDGGNPC